MSFGSQVWQTKHLNQEVTAESKNASKVAGGTECANEIILTNDYKQ